MKHVLLLTLAMVVVIGASASAFPALFDVWSYEDGSTPTWLGQISAYTGTESHVDNYNYYSASGHPINGPTPTAYNTHFWLYYNTVEQTMSFNLIHNVDAGGGNYWNFVTMDLYFMDMGYGVILQDDDPENQGQGGFADQGGGLMWADFAYNYNTDGGVIGFDPYDCCDWLIGIDPLAIGDIYRMGFASGDGGYVTGWEAAPNYCPPDGYQGPAFAITPHCEIPEPGTLLLLGTGLLIGGAFLRRKN